MMPENTKYNVNWQKYKFTCRNCFYETISKYIKRRITIRAKMFGKIPSVVRHLSNIYVTPVT